MNKVLIGFNIVLAAAVVYLFIKSPGKEEKDKKAEVKMNAAFTGEKKHGELRIAYVNIDSLNMSYDMFKDEGKRMAEITQSVQMEVAKEEEKAVRRSQSLQNVNPALLTEREKGELMAKLQRIENDFMVYKNKRSMYLDSLQADITKRAEASLRKFLKTFASEKKIDFIYRDGSFASPLLYCDTTYDITGVVLKGLNDEYNKTKGN